MYNHVAVGVYSNQRDVAATIQTLEEMSIPMTRISIGRCDGQPLDAFLKHYATPERGDMSPETWIVELPGLVVLQGSFQEYDSIFKSRGCLVNPLLRSTLMGY